MRSDLSDNGIRQISYAPPPGVPISRGTLSSDWIEKSFQGIGWACRYELWRTCFVKIQGLPQIVERLKLVTQVRPRPDGRNSEGRSDTDADHNHEERNREKLEEAVRDFSRDTQAQANGLTISAEGQGPGLRVVVKGSDGAVVRQFTGEEFIRLRESVTQGRSSPGKILDQKL